MKRGQMTFIKQNVAYMWVNLLVSTFDNPIFFFGVRYRSVMFYTRLRVKLRWQLVYKQKTVAILKGAMNLHL